MNGVDGQQGAPTATVGILDLYKMLIDIQAQMAVMNEKLADIPDHELRIRALERARFTLVGVALTLGALAGTLSAWLVSTIAHRP